MPNIFVSGPVGAAMFRAEALSTSLMRLSRSYPTLLAVGILLLSSPTDAGDTVYISPLSGGSQLHRTGTILEYTGTALTLRLAGGREEQIPTGRILGYETDLVPDQKNADQLFAQGRYADAVVGYLKAVEVERRIWLRRVILGQLVRCYKNMQQPVRAGETFLLIIRSDPTTQLWDAIPLAWKPAQPAPDLAQTASRWLENRDLSTARLMGASWLLSTVHREQALRALGELSADPDPRVALLAETQRWRDQVVTATPDQVVAWHEQVLKLDPTLRAGPYFVLGQTLARQDQMAEAALAFLRVPVLYPMETDLAAESLFAAGEQLEKLGDNRGAHTVYRELLQKHPKHALAAVAEQHLARMIPK